MDLSALESTSRALERSLDFWGILLLCSTAIVVVGLFLEYWEPVCNFFGEWHRPAAVFPSGKFWELFGGLLVTVGVAGELGFTYQASSVETRLRDNNQQIVALLTKYADDAKTSAAVAAIASVRAVTSAQEATSSASNALTLSKGARREADSFAEEIVSAMTQAAKAESDLADALQRAADAQAELNRLKIPRSLVHSDELIAALIRFHGTEYTLNVFADDESIKFTQSIAKTLDEAGWIRKQPTNTGIGVPTLGIHLSQGAVEAVPTCVDTGISILAHSKESIEAIQRFPPKAIQAAVALKSVLARSISPPDERNVLSGGVIDPELAEGIPMTICVGKKP